MDKAEDIKKNVKWIIVAVVFIIIYIIFALFVGGKSSVKTNNYIIIGDNLIWREINNMWYQEVKADGDLLNQKYIVYNGNKSYKADSVQYVSDEWYFFDSDYKRIPHNNFRVAYTDNLKIKLADTSVEGYSDSDDVYILDAINPSDETQWNIFRNRLNKVTYDFDNDGSEETIYITTNASTTVQDYDFASYLFLVKNNKVVNVIEGGDDPYGIVEVLDIDNDGNYEIVISQGIIDNATFEDCYQIYKVVNGKLGLVQNCLFNN